MGFGFGWDTKGNHYGFANSEFSMMVRKYNRLFEMGQLLIILPAVFLKISYCEGTVKYAHFGTPLI